MKKFFLGIIFVSLSLLLFIGFLIAYIYHPSQDRPGVVELKVDRGEPFFMVVKRLKENGVINNEKLFTLWARMWSLDKRIHWGVYRFDLPMAPRKVLDQMVLGRGVFHRITVPEGLTQKDIARLLEKEGLVTSASFLKTAKNPEILPKLGIKADHVEGYLFPDTYYFPPSATEEDILMAMVERFRESYSPVIAEQAELLGLDRHEVVTLASLVEKEAGVEAERPLVSAVFHNRLRGKIPLQSDPTVIYGLKEFTGNLTRKDLRRPSPYNTYLIRGLPPGPICNPGLSSLQAAVAPAEVPYLYFVSKNDGTHFFSKTIREHNNAVNQYQKSRRKFTSR
ncbi:MAG: endolytic transglycosylase MltG [Deltaproteobacteria bacterium]|nr:endolytic transglycosylase MltG [Deltaproteobacteria bacterium]